MRKYLTEKELNNCIKPNGTWDEEVIYVLSKHLGLHESDPVINTSFTLGGLIGILHDEDEFMGIEENDIQGGVGYYVNLRNNESVYSDELICALWKSVRVTLDV
ncbi:MAG: hypothetical protein GY793_01875 [Proteobacteria bacterium]|nr:hypothetical protein [Pseudomonadota bacterium]